MTFTFRPTASNLDFPCAVVVGRTPRLKVPNWACRDCGSDEIVAVDMRESGHRMREAKAVCFACKVPVGQLEVTGLPAGALPMGEGG